MNFSLVYPLGKHNSSNSSPAPSLTFAPSPISVSLFPHPHSHAFAPLRTSIVPPALHRIHRRLYARKIHAAIIIHNPTLRPPLFPPPQAAPRARTHQPGPAAIAPPPPRLCPETRTAANPNACCPCKQVPLLWCPASS